METDISAKILRTRPSNKWDEGSQDKISDAKYDANHNLVIKSATQVPYYNLIYKLQKIANAQTVLLRLNFY